MSDHKIKVRAKDPAKPVFLEGTKPGNRELDEQGRDVRVIRDAPVLVENTRYYRRRLAKGDLVKVKE